MELDLTSKGPSSHLLCTVLHKRICGRIVGTTCGKQQQQTNTTKDDMTGRGCCYLCLCLTAAVDVVAGACWSRSVSLGLCNGVVIVELPMLFAAAGVVDAGCGGRGFCL